VKEIDEQIKQLKGGVKLWFKLLLVLLSQLSF
jgi:hypothetical protein